VVARVRLAGSVFSSSYTTTAVFYLVRTGIRDGWNSFQRLLTYINAIAITSGMLSFLTNHPFAICFSAFLSSSTRVDIGAA
jgi:hypothetical protein